jgi:hypothetical protein
MPESRGSEGIGLNIYQLTQLTHNLPPMPGGHAPTGQQPVSVPPAGFQLNQTQDGFTGSSSAGFPPVPQ